MNKNNPHIGHRQRLRDQVLASGMDSMHDHQVLEYMLTFVVPQKDTNVIAHALIDAFGSFSNVLEADINSLKMVKGVGEVVAHFLYNFRDFYYYYQKNRESRTAVVSSSQSAIAYIRPILANKLSEEVYVVCIDANNKVSKTKCITKGNEKQASVSVWDITKFLTDNNAFNFFIAHNHPNGGAIPSHEDDKLTKALVLSTRVNGINMVDHIIIGKNDNYSYYMDHKIEKYREIADGLMEGRELKISQNFCKYGDEEV